MGDLIPRRGETLYMTRTPINKSLLVLQAGILPIIMANWTFSNAMRGGEGAMKNSIRSSDWNY